MSIELKPFCHEAEVLLADDFGLKLTINFRTIDRLEALLGKGMDELLGDLNASISTMVKFAWGMTREHHPDLTLEQVAGLVLSKEHGQAICASIGNLVRRAFNIADGEGEQSSRPPKGKRSSGASRGSSKSGSQPA
jgi:hypothetical protein